MSLPERLEVGPITYTVERADLEPDADGRWLLGRTDHLKARLVIHEDAEHDVARVTIAHEWLHTLWKAAGLDHAAKLADHEEQAINALAPHLVDGLRRNPDLVAYLTG